MKGKEQPKTLHFPLFVLAYATANYSLDIEVFQITFQQPIESKQYIRERTTKTVHFLLVVFANVTVN